MKTLTVKIHTYHTLKIDEISDSKHKRFYFNRKVYPTLAAARAAVRAWEDRQIKRDKPKGW